MSRLVLSLGLVCLCAGCGQKGPLYLPDKNGSVVTSQPAATAPATAAPATTPAPAAPATTTPKKSPDDGDSQNPPQS
jgi:predicted small lipoprotein YifL